MARAARSAVGSEDLKPAGASAGLMIPLGALAVLALALGLLPDRHVDRGSVGEPLLADRPPQLGLLDAGEPRLGPAVATGDVLCPVGRDLVVGRDLAALHPGGRAAVLAGHIAPRSSPSWVSTSACARYRAISPRETIHRPLRLIPFSSRLTSI